MSSVSVARPNLPRWSSRILREHWPAVGVLSVVVASSYKWRVRDPTDAVSGSVDLSTLLEVAVYGLVALGLLVAFGRDLALRHPPRGPLALAACYTFLLVLSASYSPYPSYAVVRAAEALVVLGLAAAIAHRADRRQLRGTVHAFLVLVVVSVAYGVAFPSPPVSPLQVGRFTWLQIHPTVSSVFTALALVLAVGCATGGRRHPGRVWSRWVYAGVALVDATALLQSQSRGAALGAVAGCVFVVLLQRRGRARVLLALTGLGVGGLLAYAGSTVLLAFVARGEDASQLATLNARTDLWSVAYAAVVKRPLFGYGVGSPRGIFYDATGLGGGHNEIVNVVVEVGLLGLVVWLSYILLLLRDALRGPRGRTAALADPDADLDRPLLAATIVALLIAGMFYDGTGAVATLSSTWVLTAAGWLAVLRRPVRALAPAPAAPTPGRHRSIPGPRAARTPADGPARR